MSLKKASKRIGVYAVVFRKCKGKLEFLLLHRVWHWRGWEFPKGGLKPKEKFVNGLKRELMEEIGVSSFLKIKKTPFVLRFFDKIRKKNVQMRVFVVEVPSNVKPSLKKNKCREHSSFRWVSKSKALRMLTFEDSKKIFKKACDLILR